jgi:hypothetical protein
MQDKDNGKADNALPQFVPHAYVPCLHSVVRRAPTGTIMLYLTHIRNTFPHDISARAQIGCLTLGLL